MAILGFFLKYLFLIGMVIAIFLIGIVLFLYIHVKRVAKSFKNTGKTRAQQSAANTNKRRSTEYDDGVVVEEELYDERSPRNANRKIFAKDEGEYVEFEEEK